MKNPTIKHKVCSYDGRLWVVDTVNILRASKQVHMMLRDGDEHCSAEMTWEQYDKLNSALEEQEFVILPPVVVPPVKGQGVDIQGFGSFLRRKV